MVPISFLPLLASRVTSSIFRDGIVDLNAGHMSASIYSSLFCPPSLYCVRCLRDENSYWRLLLPPTQTPSHRVRYAPFFYSRTLYQHVKEADVGLRRAQLPRLLPHQVLQHEKLCA